MGKADGQAPTNPVQVLIELIFNKKLKESGGITTNFDNAQTIPNDGTPGTPGDIVNRNVESSAGHNNNNGPFWRNDEWYYWINNITNLVGKTIMLKNIFLMVHLKDGL